MICPTCNGDGHLPERPQREDGAYRARRRTQAAETIASFRAIANQRERDGRTVAAAIWRDEAAKLETRCTLVWGDSQ